MGKLFKGKDKKASETDSAASLDAFLKTSSDNLTVHHVPPPPPPSSLPKLAKLDTTVTRYPQALGMNQQAQQNRPMAMGRAEPRSPRRSPRPNKKGLTVRFVDTYPTIIGEGGDESELPTIEISKKRQAKPAPPPGPPPGYKHEDVRDVRDVRGPPPPQVQAQANPPPADDFQPKPLARTQTGFSSIYEPESAESDDEYRDEPPRLPDLGFEGSAPPSQPPPRSAARLRPQDTVSPGTGESGRFLETTGRHDEARRSFIEIHGAQMREAEGLALAQAARSASVSSEHGFIVDGDGPPLSPSISSSPEQSRNPTISPQPAVATLATQYSPAASIRSDGSSSYTPASPPRTSHPQALPPQMVKNFSRPPPSAPPPAPQFEPAPAAAPVAPVSLPSRALSMRQPATTAPVSLPSRAASTRLPDAVAGEEALQIFVARTKHLFELFRLHAESVRPLLSSTPKDCARAGLWWFLRGRMGLETTIRERPSTPQSKMQNEIDRQQAYTNLAKGYWLCEEIVPEISTAQNLPPDDEILEVAENLVSALKKLSMSMKRNELLPPEEAFLPQTIDKSIWLEYPPLSQDMIALLSGNWGSGISAMQQPMSTLHLLDAFPLGDTPENFSYGRIMADAFLMEQGNESQRLLFPAMMSIVRPQKHSGLVFVLASQNGNIQLAIQENKNAGPVWDDIRWRNENCALEIRLPRGFVLVVHLAQQDYRMLWNMYDFGSKVKSTLYPRKDEMMIFRNTLRSFQYSDGDPQSRSFPREPVSNCEVALFEKIHKEVGPAGQRSWHRGYRIAVITGTKTRTVSGVHHTYLPYMPIQFGFFRGEGESPSLYINFEKSRQKGRMVLTFSEEKERVVFHKLLTGTSLASDERSFGDIPLKVFMISESLREPLGISPFSRMPWQVAKVVNDEFGPAGEQPPTVLSDKLRIVLEYQNGTVTDRVNVGPGELRIRLEVSNAKILRVQRQPQTDMSISVSEAQVPKELPRALSDALHLVSNKQTIRTFEFTTLKHLYDFQAALTGFEVVFDGLAATFAIARRRMVVPIHKKWEAGFTRIQLVKQEEKLQLLAFFEDFHHGHCMNFVLKGTDVYETFHRSGKAGLKFVDAKFPLPRVPADKDGDYDDMAFVCLDLPDLPGEHDDISLLFEKESGKFGFRCPLLMCSAVTNLSQNRS